MLGVAKPVILCGEKNTASHSQMNKQVTTGLAPGQLMQWPTRLRGLIYGGVLTYSALAIGSGLDRLALQGLDNDGAVAADPIDPASTALLGAAYLAAKTPLKAGAAYRTAARFGWRDPLAQVFLMDQALRFGAMDLAAMRLDAVLRHDPDFPLRDMLLARLETSQQGRTELARRLARRPGWNRQFMGEGSPLLLGPALQNRAAVLMALESPLDCKTIAPLAKRLIEADDILRARQLWRKHCPTASGEINDPGFTRAWSEVLTPFDWNLSTSGDIAAAPAA